MTAGFLPAEFSGTRLLFPESIAIREGQLSGAFTIGTTTVAAQQLIAITAASANTVTTILTVNPPGATIGPAPGRIIVGDVDSNGVVNSGDMLRVGAQLGKAPGELGFESQADL